MSGDCEKFFRAMQEYRIGVRVLGDGWWPDFSWSRLTLEQKNYLSKTLKDSKEFQNPADAVMKVVEVLNLTLS